MKSGTDKTQMSTREVILRAIKMLNETTVGMLAEEANISPVTVRHHLNSLLSDGLLTSRSVRRKVGRPYHVYSLTDEGHEQFPQRYVRFSDRLLNEVKRQFSTEAAEKLLRGVVQQIVDEHAEQLDAITSFDKRMEYLVALLDEEGFMAEWRQQEDGDYMITEHSCPYISIGAKHDEVCTFDTALMISVLQTPVEQQSCMLQGDSCCQFSVKTPAGLIQLT